MLRPKKKPGHFQMRTNDAWHSQMNIASKILKKSKAKITEEATAHYLRTVAKKNERLKLALAKIEA